MKSLAWLTICALLFLAAQVRLVEFWLEASLGTLDRTEAAALQWFRPALPRQQRSKTKVPTAPIRAGLSCGRGIADIYSAHRGRGLHKGSGSN